ncbi:unnamed protein product [Boreogadus saida]
MDKVVNCLFAAITLLLSVRSEVSRGDCNFEKPLAGCGYSQGREDDLDWEQVIAREKPSPDPWMPSASARSHNRSLFPPGRGGEGMELEVDKAGRITSSNTSKEDILYSSFFK